MPTIRAVITLRPMWKEKLAPIKFIKKIKTPPKTELITNFRINFIGFTNILPNKNTKQIQAKYVIKTFDSNSNTS